MDDEADPRQICGKSVAGGKDKFRLAVREGANEAGQLHGADIVALAVMGTALRHQHPIPVLQLSQHGSALQKLIQIPLKAGKKDGKEPFYKRI
jgi:hypothetical protein